MIYAEDLALGIYSVYNIVDSVASVGEEKRAADTLSNLTVRFGGYCQAFRMEAYCQAVTRSFTFFKDTVGFSLLSQAEIVVFFFCL